MHIERYDHHGANVAVQAELKGLHREHCLCFQGCKEFNPGTAGNCPIAAAVYRNCVQFSIVTPVWECPKYSV